MRLSGFMAGVLGLLVAGCAGEDPFDQAQRDASPGALGVASDPDGLASTDAQSPEPGTSTPVDSEPPVGSAAQPPPGQPAARVTREEADVGVTGKGQYKPGLVTTPVSIYWRARESTVFRMEIPKTMQLYKATNGHAPRSHEEFMEQIIKAGMIKLPELPPAARYVYDPEKEQLMVERPAE